MSAVAPGTPPRPDAESREWLRDLRGAGAEREDALARLHALLLRAARFEVGRRAAGLAHLRGRLDEIALEAADDALMSVVARLDDFRGASRFSTWVYKFAVLEAATKVRRRAWQARELPLEPGRWEGMSAPGPGPRASAEQAELLGAVREGIDVALSPHQRRVLLATVLDGVPIDVLAERLGTTRGALYKTLHDGRRALRRHLAARGLSPAGGDGEAG
ncbi:RNA polymerase sigma factor [Miltoncostaea marina]|uniref:RNA polymerase sigma factor n=1 Tax=Miltoncostaea marina TaxID=2843215 RepID=UPI001C3C521F|nr:sigma-70 family RNA polymerase sigma factor [Miltoncostaea marina]